MSARHKCPGCGRDRQYSFRFDSHFCDRCDIWLEHSCENPKTCVFCSDRPAKPSLRERHVGTVTFTPDKEARLPYKPD